MLTHEEIQAAISAQLDGEPTDVSNDVIETHVESCEQCRAYRDKAAALSRSLSFVESAQGMAPPQDLSEVIIAGVEPEWRRASSARQTTLTVARVALVVLGLLFSIWAIFVVVSASGLAVTGAEGTLDPTADPERARLLIEGAALRFGLAIGLFFAAWRPASVPGMLPVAATMFAFLFGFTMRDIALGTIMMSQIYILLATGISAIVLAWAWVAHKGYSAADFWRSLSANPH